MGTAIPSASSARGLLHTPSAVVLQMLQCPFSVIRSEQDKISENEVLETNRSSVSDSRLNDMFHAFRASIKVHHLQGIRYVSF
ncbi:hypothetical protein JTB14_020986 [Gonioctena quinquepunctata]|nr:hypothetical protein JTB14_020986 [Gonioctena quinquepunctata]